MSFRSKHLGRGTRWVARVLSVGLAIGLTPALLGVDIQPTYDANVTDAQKAVIEAKIALWESRLPHQSPEHVVTVSFRNADLGSSFRPPEPGVEPALTQPGLALGEDRATLGRTDNFASNSDGRPTGARITINSNAAIPWYEGLDPNVPADKYDLYSIVNHELAHALGFTVLNSRFARNVTSDPNNPTGPRTYTGGGPGGTPRATLTPSSAGTHTDPGAHPGDLMNPAFPKGVRRVPSQLDIDILKDDVWRYPTIQGSLSNFDVWNRSGLIANDFKVTLGGVVIGSISDLYNGVLNPFSPGVVTQDGDNAVIKWGPGPGQVNPGGKAHFGFKLAGGLTPLSFKFEWTQNNTVIATIPVSGTTWRQLATGNVQNRVTNNSEQAVWVVRRFNFTPAPIMLDELLIGMPLEQTAMMIDVSPLRLLPGESMTFEYPQLPGMWGVVMIADFLADEDGLPGWPLGTWLDAAELPQIVLLTGDVNCDGLVSFGDINPFVLLLSNPVLWQETYPGCPFENGDINGDGLVGFGDINPFVMLLSGT
ncbi:MAG: hypothetical protein KA383_15910 [Phycisphaerae bacterium]|nr:hypothetical protein [Phycisphaerae bacterium]